MTIVNDQLFNSLKNTDISANALAPGSGIAEVPSNEELSTLALLLKISGDDSLFKGLVNKDLAYIKAAAKLLDTDPVLRAQMGGGGFRNVLQLSGMIKQQTNNTLLQVRTARVIPGIMQDLGIKGDEIGTMMFGNGPSTTIEPTEPLNENVPDRNTNLFTNAHAATDTFAGIFKRMVSQQGRGGLATNSVIF